MDGRTRGHGLIVGKFYPPHAGHHHLINLAARECQLVTVVVMASVAETIFLDDRVAWLRAEHSHVPGVAIIGVRSDTPVDVGDDAVWRAQVASMRAAVATTGRRSITAVYTAENYGDELADRLGVVHRRVGRAPNHVSATHIRADPAAGWANLAPATRAGLATRVVVVGAESTGTTTVTRALAGHYRQRGGPWTRTRAVEEYGREYTELKWRRAVEAARSSGLRPPPLGEIVWSAEDFDAVATEQTRREDVAAADGSPLLLCDTDAFATAIWERRYLGTSARTGQPWAVAPQLPRHHLYLLTDHEGVPWSDDGLREGDLEVRAAMTGWFAEALTRAGQSWVLLTGDLDRRRDLAVRTIDQLLGRRLHFGTPFAGPGFEATG